MDDKSYVVFDWIQEVLWELSDSWEVCKYDAGGKYYNKIIIIKIIISYILYYLALYSS